MSDDFGTRGSSAPFGSGTNSPRTDEGFTSSAAAGTRTYSASDSERDAGTARSGIDQTIKELKDRFSPESAIEYGTNYIRGPGGRRLLHAARENPMAAALTLAGIGWLLYTANRTETERSGVSGGGRVGATTYGGTSSHADSRPGVMGDWSQEQNLNQPGDPGSRISRDEVEQAFGSGSDPDPLLR